MVRIPWLCSIAKGYSDGSCLWLLIIVILMVTIYIFNYLFRYMLIVIESLIWTSWHVIFLAHPKGPQKPARELNTTCGGQFTLPSVPRKSWQIWIFIYLYPKEKCELRVFTHPKCTNSCWQHLSQLSNILVAPQPWKNRWQPRTDLPHICWDGKFFKRLSMFSS